jgi:hypothetical protein
MSSTTTATNSVISCTTTATISVMSS